jgi:peptidoglycan/xylan/chitin deacetylase (PgdA/CDA1 family)
MRSRPSPKSRTGQRLFIAASILLLAALVVVGLNQFGVISFISSKITSSLPSVTVQGTLVDAQTGQPLANVPITAQIFSFKLQTTTNGQGYFSLTVPRSSQIMVSVPNYDTQPISPGSNLIIKLTPDPVVTAQRYMTDFMQHQFDQLWSMMAPDAQSFWKSESAFASFLTRKFGALPCLGFAVGQSTIVSPWINPDTTQVYSAAAVLPVSLRIGATAGVLTPPSEQAVMNGLFNHLEMAEVKSGDLWRVLVAGPLDREAPIVVPAKTPAVTAKVPILMYHHVSAQPTHNALDFSLTVKTPDFAAQMDYLAKNGYHPITLTDLFDNLYYGMALPAQPIILSFDDGYEDNFTDAFPILQRHHFVAELNIITGFIGGRYLTWNQIRQMAASGIEIGSHTVHHWSLASVLPQTARTELSQSQATLEKQLGVPIQFFCYPSGEPFHHGSLERRQLITSLLYQDGYVGALLDPGVESVIQNPKTPYQLYRIRVAGGETLAGFIDQLKIEGVGPKNDGPGA